MAEFIEVMKQRERMCNSFVTGCTECPLDKLSQSSCYTYTISNPQEVEEIIMNWAKEHPKNHEKSNEDKFKEVFGFEPIHFCTIDEDTKCKDCKYHGMEDCKSMWWNEEYKEV